MFYNTSSLRDHVLCTREQMTKTCKFITLFLQHFFLAFQFIKIQKAGRVKWLAAITLVIKPTSATVKFKRYF